MFTVNKHDFLKILEDYPEIKEEFDNIVDMRVERIKLAKEKATKNKNKNASITKLNPKV